MFLHKLKYIYVLEKVQTSVSPLPARRARWAFWGFDFFLRTPWFEHFHLKLTSLIRNAEDLDAIF